MSHATSLRIAALSAGLTLLSHVGCAPVHDDAADLGTSEAALGEAGTLTFGADFQVKVEGTLQKGKTIRVAYDTNRLTACRGDQNGKPAWTISGYWRIGDGAVHAFEAGGFSPSGGTSQPVITPDASGDLQVWFQNNNLWGCNAYDSDFGKNYHFAVRPAANEPGWVGNVRGVISRQTCNGGPCDSDLGPAEPEIVFDTWARQRAAITSILFEVWKDGTTSFDNPDLWRQLDVQMHARVGSSGPFATSYVSFDRRLGNNARYAVDLRALDPIKGQTAITKAADCPPFTLVAPAANGGQYVEASVELYFTVNGVEVRPASGGTFRVRYQNYKAGYAVCVP